MKNLILIIILLTQVSLSQDLKTGDLIRFKASMVVHNDTLPSNIVFRIQEITEDSINVEAIPFQENGYKKVKVDDKVFILKMKKDSIVDAIDYNKAGDLEKAIAANKNYYEWFNGKIYKVNKNTLFNNYEKVTAYDRVTLGVLSLPIKFRFQDGTFDTNFNIGAAVGYRLFTNQFSPYAFYVQTGLNLGTTKLTSSNSAVEAEKEINATTGTFILGAMFQYKKIQTGLYLGYDFISNQKEYNWDYNGRPWLSIGFGVDLFENKDVKIKSQ